MARRILLGSVILFLGLLILIFAGEIIFNASFKFPTKIHYGVSFSPKYAKYLGLDWQQTYTKILDELKVKNLRLPSYWDELESEEGKFNFEEVDFMVKEAQSRDTKIILVLGARQPRWPECHYPAWVKNLSLTERRGKLIKFIQEVVQRYRDYPAIQSFQVENEPFLPFFGEGCDKGEENFLRAEVAVVRSLSDKPIVLSDSGELGTWIAPMKLSHIFGTTLYRDVYNPVLGYISYPVLPYLYNLKSQLVRSVFAKSNQKTIIVELQAEPWLADGKLQKEAAEQAKLFPVKKLKSYIGFAQKTGFDEMYLWGVEWWFWMAQNGYPEYLDYAKTLFR